jgi:erythromycin esterase-like protein
MERTSAQLQRILNDGAQRERRAVRGWLNRNAGRLWSVRDLLEWLAGRTKRYRKAKGGLGR